MKDKNIVWLEGRVGDGLKYSHAENGNEYCTFMLEIDSYYKYMANKTERDHTFVLIRVFVYDKPIIEYTKRVGLKRGNKVTVFARLSSHKTEIGGKTIIQNNVVVRDLSVIKTKVEEQQEITSNG